MQPQQNRQPFTSRTQVLNDNGPTWDITSSTASHKPPSGSGSGKTPNTGSSLPRPVPGGHGHHPTHAPPMTMMPRSVSSYDIGMGHPGRGFNLKEQPRYPSQSSYIHVTGHQDVQAQPRVPSRNYRDRRDSFKPRPSHDGWTGVDHGAGRWAGLVGASVQEEDGY